MEYSLPLEIIKGRRTTGNALVCLLQTLKLVVFASNGWE
jgi:hypothetical protein